MAVRKIRGSSLERRLASVLTNHATVINELKTDFNALLAKLDADSGVGDTNYVAQRTISSPDADTVQVTY